MTRYIHTISDVAVYSNHSESSQVIQTIPAGQIVPYNREKRREGINWMEIYLDNGEKAYVKKDKKEIFICKYAQLDDDEVQGFNYKLENGRELDFYEVFTPILPAQAPRMAGSKLWIELKRIKDRTKNQTESITLEYDPAEVEITPFRLLKKEYFYVTRHDEFSKNPFMEVNGLDFNKGILLSKTSYTDTKDKWMLPIIYTIMIVTLIATFLAILATGWIVIGPILLIPAIIVAAIAVLALKIVVSIIAGIFGQIRKRL